MTSFAEMFARPQVATGNRARPLSTVNRSRRRKGGPHGYDAGKKIKGRKRHLLVDVLGLVLVAVVHPADIQDRDGAKLVLALIKHTFVRLRLIWADGGYAGQLLDWVRSLRKRNRLNMEIVKRTDDIKGFKVLPRRWVVERTFGWLGRHRRFSKDDEYLPATSEAIISIAMIGLMLRRLAQEGRPNAPCTKPASTCIRRLGI